MSRNGKLKVFQVLAGGPWGGGAVVVRALTQSLMREGYEVWVLCLSPEVSRRFSEIGANVVTSQYWKRAIGPLDLLALYDLFALCQRERFDIVHTHTSKGGFLGRIAATLAGVPVIIHTIHGFSFNELTPSSKVAFYTALERPVGRLCDVMISVTEQHRRLAIDKGIARPDKVVTIHNGINLSQFDDLAAQDGMREELGLSDQARLIGAVGRLTAEKGQVYLLEAMPSIVQKYPNAHLVFVGDGPEEAALKSQAQALGIAEHCSFLGFRRDVPRLLACFDIFVQPSPREGLSITLLEAMAAGKPVIAANITGNQEVVDDGIDGILCQPMSSRALEEAIIHLIENPEKVHLLEKRARDKVERHFDERIMLERTLELYKSQIEGSLSPANIGYSRRLAKKSS